MLRFTIPLTVAILTLVPVAAQAATITVDTTGDAIDGSGNCSLREALLAANTNMPIDGCTAGDPGADTIDVPAGTYTLAITGLDESWQVSPGGGDPFELVSDPDTAIGDLDIRESVTIAGAGAATTIVEWTAPGSDRVFHVIAGDADVDATITGLTIRNGFTANEVTNPGDPPENQWTFSRHGGAIAVGIGGSVALASESGAPEDTGHPEEEEGESGEASLTISECVIEASAAGGDGGGIYAAGPLTATNVVVSGNQAGANGGGIYNDAQSTLIGCHVSENDGENGGGMFNTGSTNVAIQGCTFAGNLATGGAGIAGRTGVTLNIENTTLSANAAGDIGGGLLTNGTANLSNSTVVLNSAGSDASFAAAGLVTFGSGSMDLSNTIIAGNVVGEEASPVNCGCTGGGCMGGAAFESSGFNLEDGDTCSLDQGSDMTNTDPMLMALDDYGGPVPTHALTPGSAALDAASNDNCTATDARGLTRPADGNADGNGDCDVGAFELSADEYDADDDGHCVAIDWGAGPMCIDGSTAGDCDDGEPGSFPGNAEVCDGLDNDCNSDIDDGLATAEYWPDVDGDGHGDANADAITACAQPANTAVDATDCDDANEDVNPDADEVCGNEVDDDCDGTVDEDCAAETSSGGETSDGETSDGESSSGGETSDGETSDGESSSGGMTTTADTDGTSSEGGTAGEDDGGGCSCTTDERPTGLGWLLLGLLGLAARRRS